MLLKKTSAVVAFVKYVLTRRLRFAPILSTVQLLAALTQTVLRMEQELLALMLKNVEHQELFA